MVEKIAQLKFDMNDWHNDGFYCFEQKKKLYRILWAAEEALKDSTFFVGEEEWLKENQPKKDL